MRYTDLTENQLPEGMRVYLDMDGVLADFISGYNEIAGTDYKTSEQLPKSKDDDKIFRKIVGTDFFARLPKLPNADRLVQMVVARAGEYSICSSPLRNDHENSRKQKTEWIKNNLDPQPEEIVITPSKGKYAVSPDGVPNILIDDRTKVINEWRAAGGIAVHYVAGQDTLDKVQEVLDQLSDSLEEAWSAKYKRSINCNSPKGFSQRAHCAGRKKTNEALLITDVPNEEWLQGKIDYAKKRGYDSFRSPHFGSTTGYIRQPSEIELPVDLLKRIPGARLEQENVRQQDLEAIKKIMQDTGQLPLTSNGKPYAPFIGVAWNGEARVLEGNHRIMAAAELGWKTLPVELKYYDGGERVKSGVLYPGKIGLETPKPGSTIVVNEKQARPNIKIMTPQEFLDQHPMEADDVEEATKLAAPSRELKGAELTQYLDRIRNQEKTKSDKYKFPYMHRSSVVGYYNEEGKKYNVDAIKAALAQRPKSLLKKNEKMKHSDGQLEQFFNIGFAALTGVALDQNANELIIVNTCPGAGSCKVDCFAMKGNKIMFQGPWLSDSRLLTYLLNDPEGFFGQLKSEIEREQKKGAKEGYKVSIRWHDSGDFFSPEYVSLAYKLARALPGVDFYAYTKIADVALGDKPKNFIINWSEGAHTSQEKKVKTQDPALATTKNSRIVPKELFYDLLIKDGSKLVKGPEGQWQVIPERLPELKQRLAKAYGISANSILSYAEWERKGRTNTSMKWNVIIAPGEPDLTAKDSGVLSTLLLKH